MFHKTLCQGLRYGSAPLGNSVQRGYHTLEILLPLSFYIRSL